MSVPKPGMHDADFKPHAFCAKQSMIPQSSTEEDACALFQPLFRGGSGQRHVENQSGLVETEELQARISLARKAHFDRGALEGQQEGCRSAQSAITPEVLETVDRINEAARLHERVCVQMADYIIELALRIAGRILTEPLELQPDMEGNLRRMLREDLAKHYRIEVSTDAAKLEEVRKLCACLGREWPASDCILIREGEGDGSGAAPSPVASAERSILRIADKIQSAFAAADPRPASKA